MNYKLIIKNGSYPAKRVGVTILVDEVLLRFDPAAALTELLSCWSTASNCPTILLLDKVDALAGDTPISLLRQIRVGYPQRTRTFPQMVILCGMRDIRIEALASFAGGLHAGKTDADLSQ